MSTVTIGYGPAKAGKSEAAREWRRGGDLRVVFDEATFGAEELRRVDNLLDSGVDIWLCYRTEQAEPALPSFPRHERRIICHAPGVAPEPLQQSTNQTYTAHRERGIS